MPGGVKLIDNTLVIVLHNGEQEIERELASPADALRVALMMLARRGRLEIGDALNVLAPKIAPFRRCASMIRPASVGPTQPVHFVLVSPASICRRRGGRSAIPVSAA